MANKPNISVSILAKSASNVNVFSSLLVLFSFFHKTRMQFLLLLPKSSVPREKRANKFSNIAHTKKWAEAPLKSTSAHFKANYVLEATLLCVRCSDNDTKIVHKEAVVALCNSLHRIHIEGAATVLYGNSNSVNINRSALKLGDFFHIFA